MKWIFVMLAAAVFFGAGCEKTVHEVTEPTILSR
jgi:hypothetical protein